MNDSPSKKNNHHTNSSSAPSLLEHPDGTTLVLIPEGEFLAGGAGSVVRMEKAGMEKPFHVHLPAYYLSKYAVTNAQYKRFVDETGHRAPPAPPRKFKRGHWKEVPVEPNHPVQRVSKKDADAYCAWAGLRLPTELEWEKGARGVDGRMYPWGNTWNPRRCRNNLNDRNLDTCAVDRYPLGKSPWGLYQMAGNTFEWCSDEYEFDAYARYQHGPLTSSNPDDIKHPDMRLWVVRGGSYLMDSGARVLAISEESIVEQMSGETYLIERPKEDYEGTEPFRCGFRMALPAGTFAWFSMGFRCAKDI